MKWVNMDNNTIRGGWRTPIWSKYYPEMEILWWELGRGTQALRQLLCPIQFEAGQAARAKNTNFSQLFNNISWYSSDNRCLCHYCKIKAFEQTKRKFPKPDFMAKKNKNTTGRSHHSLSLESTLFSGEQGHKTVKALELDPTEHRISK